MKRNLNPVETFEEISNSQDDWSSIVDNDSAAARPEIDFFANFFIRFRIKVLCC
jgi:hypothetical protein